jgi:arylsulfatase A-like enzyme
MAAGFRLLCAHVEVAQPQAPVSLRREIPRAAPAWALLGIALPLTFASQAAQARLYLREWQMIPLYATEWLVFAGLSICLLLGLAAAQAITRLLRLKVAPATLTVAAFAMVVADALVIGTREWLATFNHGTLPPSAWLVLHVGAVAIAGLGAARGAAAELLQRLSAAARPIALVGAATLLWLPWVVSVPHHPPAPASAAAGEAQQRPNIALISMDALAAAHLLTYGGQRATSPRIAAFAAHALVFDQFHANANFTTPGVATILTGVPPWTHRALQLQATPRAEVIADSLPAHLHAAGYATAYFGTNPWAGAQRQGFADYFDHREPADDWTLGLCFDSTSTWLPYLCPSSNNPMIDRAYRSALYLAAATGVYDTNRHSDPGLIGMNVARWLQTRPHAPVFLWVHFLRPHDPYAAPTPWVGRFDSSAAARGLRDSSPPYFFAFGQLPAEQISLLEARYDESIAYTDDAVGKLLAAIVENLGPNTAILVTADHGESFAHGYGGHAGVMLYEDLLHIPLIVSLPGEAGSGERRSELASQVDLAPTIAAAAGIAPSTKWPGRSLLTPETNAGERTIFSMDFEENPRLAQLSTGSVAALQGHWKLVCFLGAPKYPFMSPLTTQLYDLQADPRELSNVAAAHPDIVARLSDKIRRELMLRGQTVSQ